MRDEPTRDGVALRTPTDLSIKVVDLLPERLEHRDKHLQDAPCSLWDRRFGILDQSYEAINMIDPFRDDMAILGQVPAKGVDALRPLPH